MKLKRFLLPILTWSGLMLTSCHCEHEEDDGLLSSLQVGNVVCSDGNILSMDKFKQSDKEAVAIVFHNEEVKSPMAIRTFDLWSYGQSAYIPSVQQLYYLFTLRHQINECITEVGGTPINLNPGECWLWSSTEVEGQKENKAWLYSMQSGTIQETPKDQPHKSRPVISIYTTK